ncbi:conserved hypothetical protein [Paenibacillus curdlanolyticus YK9]|uniref:DUF6385 domain-containing protein n=1 Tax=Paenibacillus curdlanolyticus YK9 TaxID=717606 RepID=E0IEU2_9BACL|nr:DUF6385 domain-containing protein [Paenibacillus curdlanolyticus]EFM09180.1 conserved hypothetical protein [Paenibacillus curdlanolyticus YK9]
MPNFSSFNPNPDNLRTLIFGRDATLEPQALATDTSGNLLSVIMDGTISNISIQSATITAGTITSVMGATITAGTINSVLGATITAGTIDSVLGATITAGTIDSVLGATITAGTINSVLGATITAGTINSVLGATITAGTINSVLGATITAGTINSVLGATITAGTLSSVTSISQKSFTEISNAGLVTADAYTPVATVTTSVFGTYSFFVYNTGPGTNRADARVEISANGTNWYTDTTTTTGIAVGSVDVLVPQRFLKYTRLSYRSSLTGNPTTLDVFFNGQGT